MFLGVHWWTGYHQLVATSPIFTGCHQPASLRCLRKNKEEMIRNVKQEITRRADPLTKTGWGPSEIRKFVRYQVGESNVSKL